MFECPENNVAEAIDMLYVQKIVFDSRGEVETSPLDPDYYFQDALDYIEGVSENITFYYADDDFQEETYHNIAFDKMSLYFDLCKRIARHKGISFNNLPQYKEAVSFMNRKFVGTQNYLMDWEIYIPKKEVNKKKCMVRIMLNFEFSDYFGLVIALYEIRDFFLEKVEELQKEADKLDKKIIKMPPKKDRIRRAA